MNANASGLPRGERNGLCPVTFPRVGWLSFLSARKLSLVVLTAFAFSAQVIHAALFNFADRTAWETAAGGPPSIVDNFNDLTVDLELDSPGVTRGAITYSTPQYGQLFLNAHPGAAASVLTVVDGTEYLAAWLVNNPANILTISFSSPVTSWGADINPHSSDVGKSILVSTDRGESYVMYLPSTDKTEFRGFTTTEPFTYVTFDTDASFAYHGMDNVGAHAVPEPSSFAITGVLAFLGGVVLRRRKNDKQRGVVTQRARP